MTSDIFTLSWFSVFAFVMLIALIANMIIILAILRDKTMHTSTYFYIINVNVADILLVLSCVPERLSTVIGSAEGFNLGIVTCYLIPYVQQVSMHAALAFLLILTIHRCYPAGVPRFLQGDLIRRQIRNYRKTLCILWLYAIVINLPLFHLTKYENLNSHLQNIETSQINPANITAPICFTGATEIWSRTYLILLLVLTYLITGIFLIVIYGQVIRIILASQKYTRTSVQSIRSSCDNYRYLSANNIKDEQARINLIVRQNNAKVRSDIRKSHSSSSSNSGSNRRYQQSSSSNKQIPAVTSAQDASSDITKSTNSHSAQHTQVIIMLFIVIVLYILLLLPYRLFNLLYIVHNKIFQQPFMNERFFEYLLNSVRLLVFLNCALQPITYLIISSRLRHTVIKLLQSWIKCHCHLKCVLKPSFSFSISSTSPPQHIMEQQYHCDLPNNRMYVNKKYANINRYINNTKHNSNGDIHALQGGLHNVNLCNYPTSPANNSSSKRSSSSPIILSHGKNRYGVSFRDEAYN